VDFYSTAAQVIPVLVLTLLFQTRALLGAGRQDEQLSYGLIAVLIAFILAPFVGEATALRVLVTDYDTPLAEVLVTIGLALPTTALVMNVVETLLSEQEEVLPPAVRARIGNISFVAGCAAGMAVALVVLSAF
jgi:hypothetical protein